MRPTDQRDRSIFLTPEGLLFRHVAGRGVFLGFREESQTSGHHASASDRFNETRRELGSDQCSNDPAPYWQYPYCIPSSNRRDVRVSRRNCSSRASSATFHPERRGGQRRIAEASTESELAS